MSIYPDLPGPRRQAMSRDALTILLLLAFIWLGVRVHHDVDQLSGLGTGVTNAGTAVQGGLTSAGSAVGGVPIAGGALRQALDSAATATGGNVAAIGRSGTQSAHHLARVLGLVTWGLPSLLLLVLVLPRRAREVRRLRAVRSALSAPGAAARERLLALRAAAGAPEATLFAHTHDPAGDLLAGRYAPLVAAALETEGVRAPTEGRDAPAPAS